MRKLGAASLAVALCALLTGPTAALAAAAPSRVSSEPEPGEELHQAPERVSITFDQPLDPASFIAVENHCKERVDDRDTTVTGNQMEVDLTAGHSGTYHVTYHATGVAGLTGETTESFEFVVHGGLACDGGEGHHHNNEGHNGNHNGEHENEGHSEEHGGHDAEETHSGHSGSGSHDDMDMGHDDDHETHDDHDDAAAGPGGEHEGHEENGIPNFASGPTGPPLRGPDTPAVLIALGLSLVLGVLGGTVLRISAPS